MSTEEKVIQPQEFKLNPNLNTLWVDSIDVSVREDNLCLIRFLTGLPEGIFEQTRLMTNTDILKQFIDSICLSLDHYPIRENLNISTNGRKSPKKGNLSTE